MKSTTTTTRRRIEAAMILASCLWLILLGTSSAQEGVDGQNDDALLLESAKSKWEAIVTETDVPMVYSYGYVSFLGISDQGPPNESVIVFVEDETVTEVRSLYYTTDEDANPDVTNYNTIEGFFGFIEDAINDDNVTNVAVQYNEQYGYPMEITIESINATDPVVTTMESIYRLDPMTVYTFLQQDLDRNMALWTERGVADYDYTVQVSCFCFPDAVTPKRVNVLNGEIVNVTDIETGLPNDEETGFTEISIMDLFQVVQDGINDRYYRIDINYNATYGFVTYVFSDVDPQMADEEIGYTVSDWIPVDGNGGGGGIDDGPGDGDVVDDFSDTPSDTPSQIPSDSPSATPTTSSGGIVVDPVPETPPSGSGPGDDNNSSSSSSSGSPTPAPSTQDDSSSSDTSSPTTTTAPPPPITESGDVVVPSPAPTTTPATTDPPAVATASQQPDGSSSSGIHQNRNILLLLGVLGWYVLFS
jgi:hypothetical protein